MADRLRSRCLLLACGWAIQFVCATASAQTNTAASDGSAESGTEPSTTKAEPKTSVSTGDVAPDAGAQAEAPAVEATLDTESKLPAETASTSETIPAEGVSRVQYFLERVEVRGNRSTGAEVIKHFVSLEPGDLLDVYAPSIEEIRWRLLGAGWFDEVKLSLKRGARRGWVVLVIEVRERNTIVVTSVVAGLSKAVRKSSSKSATAPKGEELTPYGGLGIAETNLFGLGIGVSVAGVYSEPQQGIDLRYLDPMFLGSGYSLSGRFFYNNARDFFGKVDDTLVTINCPAPDRENPEPCDPDIEAKTAVVIYKRYGLSLGTGHDITSSLRYLEHRHTTRRPSIVISGPCALPIIRGLRKRSADLS